MSFIKVGNPTGKTDLVTQIINGLVRTAPVEKKSIHGADSAFCPRKSVLHIGIDAPEKMDLPPESTLYFAVGNAMHDEVQKALAKSEVLLENEYRVEYKQVRGYIDDIIVSGVSGGLKIIDVKTCGKLPTKIKSEHEAQLLAYALLTGITEASILYVSRSVADFNGILIKELPVIITVHSMERIARIMAESIVCLEHRMVPQKPEYRETEMGCGWCPFKQSGCFSEKEGIRKLNAPYTYGNIADLETEISKETHTLMMNKRVFYSKLVKSSTRIQKWIETGLVP